MKRSETRRGFLAATGLAAVPLGACGRAGTGGRFFTAAQARTVAAMCEQIVPADQDPGAMAAHVVTFIDRQLAGRLKRFQQVYREGLARVERTSRALSGKPFVELSSTRQTELLARLEKNDVPGQIWDAGPAREFFELVVSHTMQGFYGDPRHGGNRDALAWKMLGVPYPPVRGRDQYDLRAPLSRKPV